MPCCHPYGLQAVWSERSRHKRFGTGPGCLGKVAVIAVRFLSQPPCHRLGISHVAVHTLPRHPIDPLPWGVIGYQRQIDQTRLKIDAQPDLQSLISATMTIRLSLTASSPHSNAGHAGGEPYRLVWFQTASSIEACTDHV